MNQSYIPKAYCWDGRTIQAATVLRPKMLAFLKAHPYLRVYAGWAKTGHSTDSDHYCGFALDLVPLTQDGRGLVALEHAEADAKKDGYSYVELVWTATNKHLHVSWKRCP